jgi:hypothetical protein
MGMRHSKKKAEARFAVLRYLLLVTASAVAWALVASLTPKAGASPTASTSTSLPSKDGLAGGPTGAGNQDGSNFAGSLPGDASGSGGVRDNTQSLGREGAQGNAGAAAQGMSSGSNGSSGSSGSNGSNDKIGQQDDQPSGDVNKPVLQAVLADDNRFQQTDGALRMDVVLRVAHDSVDVNCVPLGQLQSQGSAAKGAFKCLQLYYGWNEDSRLRPLYYFNTLGTADATGDALAQAATTWAQSTEQMDDVPHDYFTIRNVKPSDDGSYDYLTVSIQGELIAGDALKITGASILGGNEIRRQLYAVVNHDKNYAADATRDSKSKVCTVDTATVKADVAHATNITENNPVRSYTLNGSGPVSGVGNRKTLGLWRSGQPNWGLNVGNGFAAKDKAGVGENAAVPTAGVAPAKSFYAYWLNSGTKCGNTTSFYYEWFGLKNGNWVPVTTITTHALASFNQRALPNTNILSTDISYNAPNTSEHYLMGDGTNQKSDGRIDFHQAMIDEGLDGYFKLVSWPITTTANSISGCVATGDPNGAWERDVYNPLTNNEQGVTPEMAESHPDQAQFLINLGTTVGTVFDGYEYRGLADVTPSRPAEPVVPAPTDLEAHTPKLVKMLAYNKRIVVIGKDELRADFVLRVGHGDVDPSCQALTTTSPPKGDVTGRCGLRIKDSYYYNTPYEPYDSIGYVNTWRDPSPAANTRANRALATRAWAQNMYDNYTIRDVRSEGKYDYLTISLESDLTYASLATAAEAIDGNPRELRLNAQITGTQGKFKSTDWTSISVQPDGKNYPLNIYYPDNAVGRCIKNGKTSDMCQGPIALPGWDTSPYLWSAGQANWGLTTDYGFPGQTTSTGVAPAKSFFVNWYNGNYHMGGYESVCSKVDKYYFQWVGLSKSGDWVPVQAVTPTAVKARGRANAYMDWTAIATNSPSQLMGTGSAQNKDGSIDFAKAMALQPELSGYFKMVTWPISTVPADGSMTGCATGSTGDVYNPLTSQNAPEGITSQMAAQDPARVEKIIDLGWTLGTAYNQFKFNPTVSNRSKVTITEVNVPHAKKDQGVVSGDSTVTVKGTVSSTESKKSTLTLYKVPKAQGFGASPESAMTDANKVGSVPISTTTSAPVPWEFSIPVGEFLKPENVAVSDVYRFIAVDTQDGLEASKDTPPVVKNVVVDMTAPKIAITSMRHDVISGTLDPRDSNKDMSKSTVVVTWIRKDGGANIVKNATVKPDGEWQVESPVLRKGADVRVDVTDESTNQGKTVEGTLPKYAAAVPNTGSRLMWVALAIVLIVLADVAYRLNKRRRRDTLEMESRQGGRNVSPLRRGSGRHVAKRNRSQHRESNEGKR